MKPAIIGISGPALTSAEAVLLERHNPAGVILFARNIEAPDQLAALVAALRRHLPDGALLMVDQEGGRVARLRPPHWRSHPPARALPSERAAWLTGALIGLDCARAGFDLVAAPVLDVGAPDGHDVIGDRAFSNDPEHVAAMGQAMAAGLLAAGVQPVGKHAPGHGRAKADSHLALPVLDTVTETDLLPFRRLAALPWLMTAHIRYTSFGMQPATLSPAIIADVIRSAPPKGIGFQGVLVTDDLAMHALTGAPGARGKAALEAGCDIALHCSGVIEETRDLLENLRDAADATRHRLRAARDLAAASQEDLDARALAEERDRILRP